jgi:serine protease
MRPLKNIVPVLATGGVLAALGVTAFPMLSVWQARQDSPVSTVPMLAPVLDEIATSPGIAPGTVVVELRDNAGDSDVLDIDRQFGIDLKPNSIEAKDDHVYTVTATLGADEASLIERLKKDSRVEAAEPEMMLSIPQDEMGIRSYGALQQSQQPIFFSNASAQNEAAENNGGAFEGSPNDPRYGEQWNFRMVGAEEAWKRSTGKGVIVAVVDTGVAAAMSPKGAPCRDFNTTSLTKGYNFVDKNDDAYDDQAHGTHVAGTIAESTNNGEGVAGLAYDATIMPVKVLSATGSGTSADVADGIRFAADHGAKVINMSLGSPYASDVIHNACKYAYKKGVTIVCAAGNSFGRPVGYPAAYPECIAISSVGPSGKIAKYSSYGKQVALAAPGGDMMDSGDPADGILQNTNFPEASGGHGDDYYAFQGTSMACPHAAAVAALIEAQGITDPARVRDILTKTAVPNGEPNKYGAGILSASGATIRAGHVGQVKLRHFLVLGIGLLTLTVGGFRQRRMGLRLAMGAAIALGMFGPDWFADRVGADSVWNLLSFSALAPMVLYVLLRRGPGVKVAGMLALGVAVNLFANWHNDTIPFTTATFGDSSLPWTMANMGAALAVGCAAAWTALRATRRRAN